MCGVGWGALPVVVLLVIVRHLTTFRLVCLSAVPFILYPHFAFFALAFLRSDASRTVVVDRGGTYRVLTMG